MLQDSPTYLIFLFQQRHHFGTVTTVENSYLCRLKQELLVLIPKSLQITAAASVDDGLKIVVNKVVGSQYNLTISNFTNYFLIDSKTYSCYYEMPTTTVQLTLDFLPGIYLVEIFYVNLLANGDFEMDCSPFVPFVIDSLTDITQYSNLTNFSLADNALVGTNITVLQGNTLAIIGANISIYGDVSNYGSVIISGTW